VKTANSLRATTFRVTCTKQASDRQQGLRRQVLEGDAEANIALSPRGCAQKSGMKSDHQPGDSSTRLERATGRKPKFELNDGSRRNALRRDDAQAAQADIRTAREGCDWLAIEGRKVKPRMEPDAVSGPVWLAILWSPDVHLHVLPGLWTVSAPNRSSLECKSNETSCGSSEPAWGIPQQFVSRSTQAEAKSGR